MKKFIIVALTAAYLTGCAYTSIKSPLDRDVNNTDLGSKIGKSNSYSVMHLVAWGDSSTATAADNGGITTIKHLDLEYYNLLFGLYSRVTTIAYGD